jgi:Protein of unknown function (DUF3221)
VKVGLWRAGGLTLLGVLGLAIAPLALARSPENGVRGVVTEVSRSAEVVLVEEDLSEESGSAKGEFAVTDETEILEQRDGQLAPVDFEAVRVGQMVEATYDGPVAESYPTRGVAGRIVILAEGGADHGLPTLPDTGGAAALAAGALLVACGLVVRYSLR